MTRRVVISLVLLVLVILAGIVFAVPTASQGPMTPELAPPVSTALPRCDTGLSPCYGPLPSPTPMQFVTPPISPVGVPDREGSAEEVRQEGGQAERESVIKRIVVKASGFIPWGLRGQ